MEGLYHIYKFFFSFVVVKRITNGRRVRTFSFHPFFIPKNFPFVHYLLIASYLFFTLQYTFLLIESKHKSIIDHRINYENKQNNKIKWIENRKIFYLHANMNPSSPSLIRFFLYSWRWILSEYGGKKRDLGGWNVICIKLIFLRHFFSLSFVPLIISGTVSLTSKSVRIKWIRKRPVKASRF